MYPQASRKMCTRRYPKAQPVTTIANALATREDPYICPTTLGIVEKKPPFPIPFNTMNTTSGARLVDTGHTASMLTAARSRVSASAEIGPTRSPSAPKPTRPTADERLNSARSAEAVKADAPREFAYNGMKKAGTRIGNVARPEPRKRSMNFGSRKSLL